MYIYREDKLPKDIEINFCKEFALKKQRITDSKFLKILSVCWKCHLDMNFDNSPDFEDLECIRESDFKYYVLDHLTERLYGLSIYERNKLEQEFKQVLKGEKL